jgi:hypothetical protein
MLELLLRLRGRLLKGFLLFFYILPCIINYTETKTVIIIKAIIANLYLCENAQKAQQLYIGRTVYANRLYSVLLLF